MEMVKNRDMIKPNLKYPEDFINKIICGDCLELIKLIPDNSIDAIITDPPYGLNKRGIQNDADLSLFYSLLPECNRILQNVIGFCRITVFLLHFLAQNFFHSYLKIILSIIFGKLFYIVLREGLNLP